MKTKWQPIETAPKDGTDILIYLQYTNNIVTGRRGRSTWVDCWLSDLTLYKPSHWMPLPSPPNAGWTEDDESKALEAIANIQIHCKHGVKMLTACTKCENKLDELEKENAELKARIQNAGRG